MFLYTRNHLFKKLTKRHDVDKYLREAAYSILRKFQRVESSVSMFFPSSGGFMYCLRLSLCYVTCLGVPLEEEEAEEEDASWTGKFRALVYKIKGSSKPEKERPTEEEERCPSKFQSLSITLPPTWSSSKT